MAISSPFSYTDYMTADEQKTIHIINAAVAAVVSIQVSDHISHLEKKSPTEIFPVLERDKERADILAKKIAGESIDFGGGTGFITDPSGIIVTNIHVVYEGSLDYTVTTHDKASWQAKLVGTDSVHDIAYLKIDSPNPFPSLALGDSATLQLGQTVYAIGNVLGIFEDTISRGIISGLGRAIAAHNEDRHELLHGLIQTDAAINPGNSGGPLIDSDGCVIGINAANVAQAENIGFAIPVNIIKNDLADIRAYGRIRRAFLGVRHIVISPHVQKLYKLPVSEGILVTSPGAHVQAVIPDSPADRGGIRDKDIIIAIDSKPLTEDFTLEDFLEDAQGNQTVTLDIIRKEKRMAIETVLQEKT